MKIVATMKKFPGGMMVIPLVLGCLVNTFIPGVLEIGGFTTGLFKTSVVTLVGLFILCSGATIDLRQIGIPIYKGITLTIIKYLIGVVIGFIVYRLWGSDGVLTLTPLAIIAALTNSNGAIYVALANEFGDKTDAGAIAILSVNDGPFLTMIALGTTGLAEIPFMALVATFVPLCIGLILGNLDSDFKKLLENGIAVLLPFNGFAFGANMDLWTIFDAGVSGIILGLITVIFTGVVACVIYSFIRRKVDPMGMAIGTVGGNAVATPAALALADPSLNPIVGIATAQIAASVVITALLTPPLTGFIAKKMSNK